MRVKIIAALFCLTAVCGCLTSKSSQRLDDMVPKLVPPEEVANYERDVIWASPGGRDILLDASWPEGDGPFPVLVWIHGGSWEFFSKEANEGLARFITNRGYVVFNVNYRMAPEVPIKTIVEDAMGVVIWAKDHAADYNGDPHRLAVAGHSAGGHLCAMVTTACGDPFFTPTYQSDSGADCRVSAAVPVSGVYDFIARGKEDPEKWERVFGVSYPDDPSLYERMSPITRVRADLPPQLVVYAGDEELREANENWIAALEAAGAPVTSYMEPDVDHVWIIWHWKKPALNTYAKIVEFLDSELKK